MYRVAPYSCRPQMLVRTLVSSAANSVTRQERLLFHRELQHHLRIREVLAGLMVGEIATSLEPRCTCSKKPRLCSKSSTPNVESPGSGHSVSIRTTATPVVTTACVKAKSLCTSPDAIWHASDRQVKAPEGTSDRHRDAVPSWNQPSTTNLRTTNGFVHRIQTLINPTDEELTNASLSFEHWKVHSFSTCATPQVIVNAIHTIPAKVVTTVLLYRQRPLYLEQN